MKDEVASLRRIGNYERIPAKSAIGPLYVYDGIEASSKGGGHWRAGKRIWVTEDFFRVDSRGGTIYLLAPNAVSLSSKDAGMEGFVVLSFEQGKEEIRIYALAGDEAFCIRYWEELRHGTTIQV